MLKKIKSDIAAHTGNSSLISFMKAILFSPGFSTIFMHRIAQKIYSLGPIGRTIGKVLWRLNTATSSCHISLNAHIGGGLCLPHPTAIVIGSGVTIGDDVTIYQSVTLGTSSPKLSLYPTIKDGATIYAGSVVVGEITIGERATIGANSYVSKSINDDAIAVGSPATEIKK